MKVCKRCRQSKQETEFYVQRDNDEDGLQDYCKACSQEVAAAWRVAHHKPPVVKRDAASMDEKARPSTQPKMRIPRAARVR